MALGGQQPVSAPFILPIGQPLDLTSTLAGGQCFRWRQDDQGRWHGVIGEDIVRLSMTDDGLVIESSPTSPAEIAESIVSYMRLDDDLTAIQKRLSSDQTVRQGIEHYPGMRIMRQEPWETLAGFILSSTSNIPRISGIMESLAETFGTIVSLPGLERTTFPSPDVLAEAGEDRLREMRCGFRAPYLAGAAHAVASGDLSLGELRGAPYQEVLKELTSLHGVGEKIADCVMLFSLDRSEAFPADRWVRKVLTEWYDLPLNVTYDGARQWAWNRFGSDAGYANQYLFWYARQSIRPMRLG